MVDFFSWISDLCVISKSKLVIFKKQKSTQAKEIILSNILTAVENGLDLIKKLIYLEIFIDSNISNFL